MLRQLRQPRYLALGMLMLLIAALCVLAGTWQVARFLEKHDANRLLRDNARSVVAPVAVALSPTGAPDAAHRAARAQYRPITATGTYLADRQLLVRGQSVEGTVVLLVLTPLRTDTATLLVVRGHVPADGTRAPSVTAPPSGRVSVIGRAQPPDTESDHFGEPAGQVRSINAADAATRLPGPVYDGYVELFGAAPGTQGVTAMPTPDLSNPAGGAVEPQHMAYIAQWYLFALLALAAPPVIARAESRRPDEAPPPRRIRADHLDDDAAPADPDEAAHRRRMLDRYGIVR